MLDVDVGGRDEGVDARALRVLDRTPGGVDVRLVRAREPADRRPLDVARDLLHGLEVTGRGDREAGLDHVDAEPRELLRNLDLLLRVERDPRRLLAVAQRRVEDVDPVLLGYARAAHACLLLVLVPMTCDLAALAPPSATPPGGGEEGEAPGCRAGASFGAWSLAQGLAD